MRQEYVLAVLEEHILQYGPGVGQICSCGYVAPKDPDQVLSQQTKHHTHLADLIAHGDTHAHPSTTTSLPPSPPHRNRDE